MMICSHEPAGLGEDAFGRHHGSIHGEWSAPADMRLNLAEESVMKWQTPRAIDFRFGMEITMYIANR